MRATTRSRGTRATAMDGRDSITNILSRKRLSVLHTNHTACFPGHHFFPVLVATDPTGNYFNERFRWFHLDHQNVAGNRVAGEDRTMKLENQFARNEVEIAANFGWQSRR